MRSNALSVEEYISQIPEEKQEEFQLLRSVIRDNLPNGFIEEMNCGMIGYVVPHSIYPNGYHCDPKLPLPFMNLAAQKNFIALYHMGIYASPELLKWFTNEFQKYIKLKPDMGKSCIRFKNTKQIPYILIGELTKKIQINEWINMYELNLKR